jgi:electron transport protein HydN
LEDNVSGNAIVTHAEVCRDCEACALVCSLLHEGASNPLLSRVLVKKDMQNYKFSLTVCRQCEDDPECLSACPNEAIRLDERGVVVIFEDECLQCGACALACPYGAIYFNENTGAYYKCDLCRGVADSPACVAVCPVDALTVREEARV